MGNSGTHAYSQGLRKNPPYNSVTDFTPIGLVTESPRILLARKDLPVNNLQEFVEIRESEPGQDAVRLRWRRLRHAPALRAPERDARRQDHACSLQGRWLR